MLASRLDVPLVTNQVEIHPLRLARFSTAPWTNRLERIASAAGGLELELERQDWFALWSASTGTAVP